MVKGTPINFVYRGLRACALQVALMPLSSASNAVAALDGVGAGVVAAHAGAMLKVASFCVVAVSVTTPAPVAMTLPRTFDAVIVMAPSTVLTLPPIKTWVSVTTPAPVTLTLPPTVLPAPTVMPPAVVLMLPSILTFVVSVTIPAP